MRIQHLWSQQGLPTPDLNALHVFFIGEPDYIGKVMEIVLL